MAYPYPYSEIMVLFLFQAVVEGNIYLYSFDEINSICELSALYLFLC
jgi:hypothetical protein